MAIFNLTETVFEPIPEGEHIFLIEGVEYNSEFKSATVTLVTQNNQKLFQHYQLNITGACNAFSWLIKKAMDDNNIKSIDPEQIIGKYIRAEVVHNKALNRDGEEKIYCGIKKISSANGFVVNNVVDLDNDDEFFEKL